MANRKMLTGLVVLPSELAVSDGYAVAAPHRRAG